MSRPNKATRLALAGRRIMYGLSPRYFIFYLVQNKLKCFSSSPEIFNKYQSHNAQDGPVFLFFVFFFNSKSRGIN